LPLIKHHLIIRIKQVIVHHVEMHEFCLWCDFKSLKENICEKVLKLIVKKICENWCKG
jgi:hypothetical protein